MATANHSFLTITMKSWLFSFVVILFVNNSVTSAKGYIDVSADEGIIDRIHDSMSNNGPTEAADGGASKDKEPLKPIEFGVGPDDPRFFETTKASADESEAENLNPQTSHFRKKFNSGYHPLEPLTENVNFPSDLSNFPTDFDNLPKDFGNLPKDFGNLQKEYSQIPKDYGNIQKPYDNFPKDFKNYPGNLKNLYDSKFLNAPGVPYYKGEDMSNDLYQGYQPKTGSRYRKPNEMKYWEKSNDLRFLNKMNDLNYRKHGYKEYKTIENERDNFIDLNGNNYVIRNRNPVTDAPDTSNNRIRSHVPMDTGTPEPDDKPPVNYRKMDTLSAGQPSPYVQHDQFYPNKMSDFTFTALVAGCTTLAVFGVVGVGMCWYRLHKNQQATADAEYPAYGVTGPAKDGSPGAADRKLAQSAHMYHYQHRKEQMIALDKSTGGERQGSASDVDSDDECEEGDYTVYECPGLASTGEMEVKNPLFQDEPTPATPAKKEEQ